ncbi:hypothetical protein VP01_1141g3 [Puccinia sorghi]|uniref:Uncharacterized protein n=1 Tax=Puccinia sorghi TaxID=27349 RepID=A0A0L6VTC0_9BASI|nr:hypothetical protein VP01_1141g3 [Puccinia sorghi]
MFDWLSLLLCGILSEEKSCWEILSLILLPISSTENLTIKLQYHKLSAQFHQQKIKTLQILSSVFNHFLGKVPHFSLGKAQKNYKVASKMIKQKIPPQYCKTFHTIRTGLPCVPKIQAHLLKKELLEPGYFHAQWNLKVFLSLSFSISLFFLLDDWWGAFGGLWV